MEGFQFADILILALIAGFIALRLRNTLGKDIGRRPDITQLRQQISKDLEERVVTLPGVKVVAAKGEEKPADKLFDALPEDQKEKLSAITAQDAAFSYSEFLEGAKGAFEWVVKAFNEGDKSTLKQLLAKEVYQEFEEAMIDRLSSPAQAHATLVAIDAADLVDARIKGDKAQIVLRFQSDQIHLVKNEKGEVISGNPSEITRVQDEWTFERSLISRDPNWTIIDT